jgi:thioredoxin
MVRAVWNGEVIAESDDTVVIEGNHYFPVESVRVDLLRSSTTTSVCPWKGRASYYSIVAGGKENRDAAWFYPTPSTAASAVTDHVAFWHGVKIEDDGGPAQRKSFFGRFRKTDTDPPASAEHAHAGPAPVIDLTDATFFDSLDGHATIVDFWAPWCGPCKALHPIFDHLAHHHADEHVHFARVNVDENQGVASGLGVMSIPTLLLCDTHGNEIDRIVGLTDARTLEQFVQRAGSIAGSGSKGT